MFLPWLIYEILKELEIIFVSATKIGEKITSIFNCYFSKYIYTLAHQTY